MEVELEDIKRMLLLLSLHKPIPLQLVEVELEVPEPAVQEVDQNKMDVEEAHAHTAGAHIRNAHASARPPTPTPPTPWHPTPRRLAGLCQDGLRASHANVHVCKSGQVAGDWTNAGPPIIARNQDSSGNVVDG